MKELHNTQKKCDSLAEDLESERTSRQQYQHRVRELDANLSSLQNCVNKSAFVLVLIDADHDGYVFKDDYINDGSEGGKTAAQELQKAVRSKLKVHAIGESVPVMVRAFANTEGLSKTLEGGGMSDASEMMARFIQGFNQVKFCDFVSVGSGKDRADEKIKGTF